jgi:hypothetical protein
MDRTSDLSPFVIDNNTKRVVHLGEYLKIYNITDLRPYKWYELLWKFGTAKVIKIYLKARGRWKN